MQVRIIVHLYKETRARNGVEGVFQVQAEEVLYKETPAINGVKGVSQVQAEEVAIGNSLLANTSDM
jgi:hypothetical protein